MNLVVEVGVNLAQVRSEVSLEFAEGSNIKEEVIGSPDNSIKVFIVKFTSHSASKPAKQDPSGNLNPYKVLGKPE